MKRKMYWGMLACTILCICSGCAKGSIEQKSSNGSTEPVNNELILEDVRSLDNIMEAEFTFKTTQSELVSENNSYLLNTNVWIDDEMFYGTTKVEAKADSEKNQVNLLYKLEIGDKDIVDSEVRIEVNSIDIGQDNVIVRRQNVGGTNRTLF